MADPLPLSTIDYPGPSDAPPLVIAHGLFGSARNWGVVARRLSDRRRVVAVDMRNHGDSPHAADHSYAALAADLVAVIEGLGGRADLLGHSMGGKAAMLAALRAPDTVGHLIVADIAPVAYRHTQAPVVEALRAVDLTGVGRRSEADARLAPALPDGTLRAFLLQSLSVGPDGARWKLNLTALAAEMPRIMGFPPAEPGFAGPVTVLSGGASDYVDDAGRAALRALFPQATVETLAGAGHWLHAEDPRGFEAMVRAALGRR